MNKQIVIILTLSMISCTLPTQKIQDIEVGSKGMGSILQSGSVPDGANISTNKNGTITKKPLDPDDEIFQFNRFESKLNLLTDQAILGSKVNELKPKVSAIMKNIEVPEHPVDDPVLEVMADMALTDRNYNVAEKLYTRALAIKEKNLGTEHIDVAKTLDKLATIYRSKGDIKNADSFHERALKIFLNLGPEDHDLVADALNNTASIYMAKGEYIEAELTFRKALKLLEKYDLEHPNIATLLGNLAEIHRIKGEYGHAEFLNKKVLKIRQKKLLPEHPAIAVSLNNIALMHMANGEYIKAEPLFQYALTIFEKVLGFEHPLLANILINLGTLHWYKNELEKAFGYFARANIIEEKYKNINLSSGTEQQKIAYSYTFVASTSLFITFDLEIGQKNKNTTSLALTTLMQRKIMVLDFLTQQLSYHRSNSSPDGQKLINDYQNTITQISNLSYKAPDNGNPDRYKKQLTLLETKKDQLETQLSSNSTEFKNLLKPITLDGIQKSLPPKSALIELAVYRPFTFNAKSNQHWGSPRYAAYILHHTGTPHGIDLGDKAEIDNLIKEFLQHLNDQKAPFRPNDNKRNISGSTEPHPRPVDPEIAKTLTQRIWRPIQKLLGITKNVLIAPDGLLNLIPFEALVDNDGHYLIESYYISYLTSGRDLLRLEIPSTPKTSALVVGDPDFSSVDEPKDTLWLNECQTKSNFRAYEYYLFSRRFQRLCGTKDEVETIAKLLNVNPIMGKAATEAVIKKAKDPIILHLATHGFFEKDLNEAIPSLTFSSHEIEINYAFSERYSPLLRSGLALAGLNSNKSGQYEDGRLTAMEVSGLNLKGTRMAVLSACDTGVGDIKNGEGVYGLRRALVNAGARTQVMSLWKVNDAATKDLMVDFYKRLSKGEGRADAMRQAKLAMLKDPNRSHPYYWASFILSGDWRPMADAFSFNSSGS